MSTLILHTRRQWEANRATVKIALVFGTLLAGTLLWFDAAQNLLANVAIPAAGIPAALAATLVTALATGAGALPVLFARRVPKHAQHALLGFGAGVMLAASVFSLILPALAAGIELTGSQMSAGLITAAGVLLGGLLLLAMDRTVPHEHRVQGRTGGDARDIARVWLFVFAITLHNIPEGLAVGVAFAADSSAKALPLALGIAVQNMPEGLAVALALLTLNYSPARAAGIALATGLVEPIGGLIGAGAISISTTLLPWGLAFAAGAMLFVVIHEIIPETHRQGHQTHANVGLVAGFLLMMLFDTMLA